MAPLERTGGGIEGDGGKRRGKVDDAAMDDRRGIKMAIVAAVEGADRDQAADVAFVNAGQADKAFAGVVVIAVQPFRCCRGVV